MKGTENGSMLTKIQESPSEEIYKVLAGPWNPLHMAGPNNIVSVNYGSILFQSVLMRIYCLDERESQFQAGILEQHGKQCYQSMAWNHKDI